MSLPALSYPPARLRQTSSTLPRKQNRPPLMVWLHLILLLTIFIQSGSAIAAPPAQSTGITAKAQALLEQMSDAERVGQLFLLTFRGSEVGEDSSIYNLIVKHNIGGVVLLSENDNFNGQDGFGSDLIAQTLSMNRQLQLNRWAYIQQVRTEPAPTGSPPPVYVPLFIAISQEGDGWPNDQILSGLSRLPNQAAIGATWNTQLATRTGAAAGSELNALGINLLLGPSLDVVEDPNPEGSSVLGAGAFGGDPFWVSQMGGAYITGVHQGSNHRVAVAAKHFPGIGSADRLPEEEVATVRKSLEQLQNFDLAPFFDVTDQAPGADATTDALLTTHMRYQGFQGNIRTSTRPISFDQQALNLLMGLQPFATWRQNGGLMISDNLGSRSVRRFYELTNPNQSFDARLVALNAFLAGNDLLYLGNIISSEDPDASTTAGRIIDFFTQKYREDPAFAQRVDQAALRILSLKVRLYGDFTLNNIVPALDGTTDLGKNNQVTFDVARQAATLISPSPEELDSDIPDPPNQNDRIVFITDVRQARQCSLCLDQSLLEVDALQQAVLRLYGPQASGQITPAYLKSYSYEDLIRWMDGETGTRQFDIDLQRARWLVFGMLDARQDLPSSMALHRFLAERPELIQQKRMVAFAFNMPIYLDATDISKLNAYYGLYSKGPSFVETAARLLFKELQPLGNSPVSVSGIGYDLIFATQPDPDQVIPLLLDLPEVSPAADTTPAAGLITPTLQPTLELRRGSPIAVRSGVILDHNGHPVPDGTPVLFIATLDGAPSSLTVNTTTLAGVARGLIQVPGSGKLEIRVESEPAKTSQVLQFEIPPENEPAYTPTPTSEPTATPTSSPTATDMPIAPSTASVPNAIAPGLADWSIASILSLAVALLCYQLSAMLGQVRWGIRAAFLAFIGGMLAYTSLTLQSNLSRAIFENMGIWGVIVTTLAGCAAGIATTWLWRAMQTRPTPES